MLGGVNQPAKLQRADLQFKKLRSLTFGADSGSRIFRLRQAILLRCLKEEFLNKLSCILCLKTSP